MIASTTVDRVAVEARCVFGPGPLPDIGGIGRAGGV